MFTEGPTVVRRIRNPGRRGLNAETHRFIPRIPLELALRNDPTYRYLRYCVDVAERKLALLRRAGASAKRISAVESRLVAASAKCAEYLLTHLPETEPTVPIVLEREIGPDGELVGETESPVEASK